MKINRFLLPGIFILALGLRLFMIGSANYWYDESFTVDLSRLDFSQMIGAIAGDTHPPLYYLLTWLIVHFAGSSEWLLRLPSALFSLGALWFLYRIGLQLQLDRKGLMLGLALVAISGLQIHFSQEARMYGLFELEILATLYFGLKRRWFWAGLLSLAGLYTHNYGLFYIPIIGAAIFAIEIKDHPIHLSPPDRDKFYDNLPVYKPGDECQVLKAIAAFLVPMVLFIPWSLVLFRQMSNISGGYWIQPITPGNVLYSLYMLFWGFSMPEVWQPLAVMVAFGLLGYTLTKKQNFILVWVAFMPVIIAVLFSLLWKPVLLFRGLLPTSPLIFLMAGIALTQNKPVIKTAYAMVFLLPVMVAGLAGFYLYNPTNKGNTQEVINTIRLEWQPGDIVYHLSDGSLIGWLDYAPDLPQYELPPCGLTPGAMSIQTRAALNIPLVQLQEIDFKRAWVIWSDGPLTPDCEREKANRILANPKIILRNDDLIYSGVWLYANNK